MCLQDRELLLLGILMAHSQHGYQINEFIEMNLSRVTDMKKSTAYATLDRLAASGFVDMHSEQAGNRPTRKVYSLTACGMDYFYQLLRDNLGSADAMQFTSDIGLAFIDHLQPSEVIDLLEKRRQALAEKIKLFRKTAPHGFVLGVDLATEHQLLHLEADYGWLGGVIEKIRASLAESVTLPNPS